VCMLLTACNGHSGGASSTTGDLLPTSTATDVAQTYPTRFEGPPGARFEPTSASPGETVRLVVSEPVRVECGFRVAVFKLGKGSDVSVLGLMRNGPWISPAPTDYRLACEPGGPRTDVFESTVPPLAPGRYLACRNFLAEPAGCAWLEITS
jgi:hypothetical protein